MVTTDLYHGCTEEFKGTSAAAPIAAGMIALALEANPNLTWRDVQHLLVHTAQKTSPMDGWQINAGGFHFNHKFGFGRMDAAKLVEVAKKWKTRSQQLMVKLAENREINEDIQENGEIKIQVEPDIRYGDLPIKCLEHVILTISYSHRRRGDVSIDLTSPFGTKSSMLSTRKYDDSTEGLDDWNFMTVANWGESPMNIDRDCSCALSKEPCACENVHPWVITIRDNTDGDTRRGAEPDIEELEEQVIDKQIAPKKLEWKETLEKDPDHTWSYPKGIRKTNIPNRVRDVIPRPGVDIYSNWEYVYDTDGHGSINNSTEKPVNLTKDATTTESTSNVPMESDPSLSAGFTREKKDIHEKEKLAIFKEYMDFVRSKSVKAKRTNNMEDIKKSKMQEHEQSTNPPSPNKSTSIKRANKMSNSNYKKVQVQEDELTGTPRVQVNAGKEPFIKTHCKNRNCIGIFETYSLTLYGTGDAAECKLRYTTGNPD